MSEPTFTAGQRVFHNQRKQFGVYVEDSWTSGESIVAFPRDPVPGLPDEDEELRVTTAQLVAADEVEGNA
jgi:hypothetical protein